MNETKLNQVRLEIGVLVKKRRLELAMTHEDLAAKCKIHSNTVSNIENGKFWVNTKIFVLICEALELDFKNIFKKIFE